MAEKRKRISTAESIVKDGEKKRINMVIEDNKNFIECLNVIAATPEGQYFFNRIMNRCSAMKSLIILDANRDIDDNVLQVNVGKQSVWFDEIHKYMNVKNLKRILFFDRSRICSQKRKIQDGV